MGFSTLRRPQQTWTIWPTDRSAPLSQKVSLVLRPAAILEEDPSMDGWPSLSCKPMLSLWSMKRDHKVMREVENWLHSHVILYIQWVISHSHHEIFCWPFMEMIKYSHESTSGHSRKGQLVIKTFFGPCVHYGPLWTSRCQISIPIYVSGISKPYLIMRSRVSVISGQWSYLFHSFIVFTANWYLYCL